MPIATIEKPTSLKPEQIARNLNQIFAMFQDQRYSSDAVISFDDYLERITRDKATIKEELRRYRRNKMIEEIRELAKHLGKQPTYTDVLSASKKHLCSHPSSLINCFSSFNKCLEQAGFEPKYRRKRVSSGISKQELASKLRELSNRLGRTPTRKDVNDSEGIPSGAFYSRTFGSFNSALEAAGLCLNKIPKYPEAELLSSLKDTYRKLGKAPTVLDIDRESKLAGKPNASTYRSAFGSLNQAFLKAGIHNRDIPKTYSSEELIAQLHSLQKTLGHMPHKRDIDRLSKEGYCASYRVFLRVFGNIEEARIAAGFNPYKSIKYIKGEQKRKEFLCTQLNNLATKL
jgi:hypothetical protein